MLTARMPHPLRVSLDSLAGLFGVGELIRAAHEISASYRNGVPARPGTNLECAAYALTRMPATFAAISTALREVEFAVGSVLDLGAGTGAGGWAAATAFGVGVRSTLIERNPQMRALGQRLDAPPCEWRDGDMRNLAGIATHDLVLFGYSLGEQNQADAREIVKSAWERAAKGLLIVEPGTPSGTVCVLRARETLLSLGAKIAAPCPHENACPLKPPDWCHFAVRVERSRIHRQLKGGDLGYEDEKFSYVLAVRPEAAVGASGVRILRHPQVAKGMIQLTLCTPTGVESIRVRSSHKTAFREARKASWGEEWKERAAARPDS